jgi:hypothetical protein
MHGLYSILFNTKLQMRVLDPSCTSNLFHQWNCSVISSTSGRCDFTDYRNPWIRKYFRSISRYLILNFNVCDKEHLPLRNNFRVTKKFLITKFDCTTFILHYSAIFLQKAKIFIYLTGFPVWDWYIWI